MHITYHQNTQPKGGEISINHCILNKEIQDFIKDTNATQLSYIYDCNGYYTFIYLKNGDRIDISH